MALSVIVIPGDGVTKQFSIPFSLGYLGNTEFVTCRVGSEVDGTGAPVYRNLTFLSDETVVVSGAAPGVGVPVRFERTVPRNELLVNYEDDAIINEENMNTSQLQLIMLVQEIADGRFSQFQTNVDMAGNRFTNMGNPVNAQDGATKFYVDASYGSNLANLNATLAARDEAIAARNQANTAAAGAKTSETNAKTSETNAATSRTQAANSASAAATSRTNALTSENNSKANENASAVSAAAALASQNAAKTSETNAKTSETNAKNSEAGVTSSANAAAASATAANTSATNAATSATNASTSASSASSANTAARLRRDQAQLWAQAPQNQQIDDGTNPVGYSAYHWSKIAEQAAGGGVSSWIGLAGSITKAQAEEALSTFGTRLNLTASINLPTVAAADMANGDMWMDPTTGLFLRYAGVTRYVWDDRRMGPLPSNAVADAGTETTTRPWSSALVRRNVMAAPVSSAVQSALDMKLDKTGGAMAGGLTFGASTVTNPPDLSRHLALYGTTYGFSVTGSSFNSVSQANWQWVSHTGVVRMSLSSTGILDVPGGITTPKPATGDNSNRVATTSFVAETIAENVPVLYNSFPAEITIATGTIRTPNPTKAVEVTAQFTAVSNVPSYLRLRAGTSTVVANNPFVTSGYSPNGSAMGSFTFVVPPNGNYSLDASQVPIAGNIRVFERTLG